MLHEVQAISAVNSQQRAFQTLKFSKVWCQLATLCEKVWNPNSFDFCSGCFKVCLASFFKFLAISIFKSGKIASPNAQTDKFWIVIILHYFSFVFHKNSVMGFCCVSTFYFSHFAPFHSKTIYISFARVKYKVFKSGILITWYTINAW